MVPGSIILILLTVAGVGLLFEQSDHLVVDLVVNGHSNYSRLIQSESCNVRPNCDPPTRAAAATGGGGGALHLLVRPLHYLQRLLGRQVKSSCPQNFKILSKCGHCLAASCLTLAATLLYYRNNPHCSWGGAGPLLTTTEISLVRSTFSSYRSVCWVGGSAARLLVRPAGPAPAPGPAPAWRPLYSGPLVPLLVLNQGGSRARAGRGLELVLAERGSGLAVWRDRLDSLRHCNTQSGSCSGSE